MNKLLIKIANILPPSWFKFLRNLPIISNWNYWVYRYTGKCPLPSSIIIDPVNICNLNCPMCPTGRGFVTKENQGVMKLEVYKKVIDEISTLKRVSLFNWGESFLNPDIIEMIKYAKSKKIFVNIHSNLSFKRPYEFWEKVVGSEIDRISVSLDGASQENYVKYRKNGDFNQVIENLKVIEEIKRKDNSKTPLLIWKFIPNKFNENEVEEASSIAKKIGVKFDVETFGVADSLVDTPFPESIEERIDTWIPTNQGYQDEAYKGEYNKPLWNTNCKWLFETPIVAPSGKVYPCCFLTKEANTFGNINNEHFKDIWNNEKYKASRDLFVRTKQDSEVQTICSVCENYKKKQKKT